MEPQIIDYYNDYPSSINIIDKLNEEYENLRYIYEIKNKKLNRYKIPYTIYETLIPTHIQTQIHKPNTINFIKSYISSCLDIVLILCSG